jgi:hypothetical protein
MPTWAWVSQPLDHETPSATLPSCIAIHIQVSFTKSQSITYLKPRYLFRQRSLRPVHIAQRARRQSSGEAQLTETKTIKKSNPTIGIDVDVHIPLIYILTDHQSLRSDASIWQSTSTRLGKSVSHMYPGSCMLAASVNVLCDGSHMVIHCMGGRIESRSRI